MNFNKDINSFYLNIAIQRTSLNLYTTLADGIAKNGYSIDDMSNMSGLSKKTIKDILKMKSKVNTSDFIILLNAVCPDKKVEVVDKDENPLAPC